MYRAKRVCFVGAALRKEGDVFEYNGPENHHLEPLEPVKPKEEPQPEAETGNRKWTPKAKRQSGADEGSN